MGLKKVLVIVGPTAVGKSEVAVGVAKAIGGEIVSADSRQIYRGIEIGSGAPSARLRNSVPHHLIGVLPLEHRISAGEFAEMGRRIVGEIVARGKVPIVVGGSGLFVRALIDGLAPTPPASAEVRQVLEEELARRGFEVLHNELREVDPNYAVLVLPSTKKRLIRALEVYRLTGRPLSEWHKDVEPQWCIALKFGLERPRTEVRELIALRVHEMVRGGWVEEVTALLEHYGAVDGLPPSAREALGVLELAEVIEGRAKLDEAIELIINQTRQFAKRQMTWFKSDKEIEWLASSGPGAVDYWVNSLVSRDTTKN